MWRADIFYYMYRGMKRSFECMDNPETQDDTIKRLSIDEYITFARNVVGFMCSMPKVNMSKARHSFTHTIQDPINPCGYVDIKMFIDIHPANTKTMEVTFFRKNDSTRLVDEQIAHAEFEESSCMAKLNDLLTKMFAP